MVVDQHLARELELFYENDQELYRGRYIPFVKNYIRRMKKGTYNRALAVKGIRDTFIPAVIHKYNKEVAKLPPVNRETKQVIAERWVAGFEQDYKDGQFEDLKTWG